jgi:hypothetical protein
VAVDDLLQVRAARPVRPVEPLDDEEWQ